MHLAALRARPRKGTFQCRLETLVIGARNQCNAGKPSIIERSQKCSTMHLCFTQRDTRVPNMDRFPSAVTPIATRPAQERTAPSDEPSPTRGHRESRMAALPRGAYCHFSNSSSSSAVALFTWELLTSVPHRFSMTFVPLRVEAPLLYTSASDRFRAHCAVRAQGPMGTILDRLELEAAAGQTSRAECPAPCHSKICRASDIALLFSSWGMLGLALCGKKNDPSRPGSFKLITWAPSYLRLPPRLRRVGGLILLFLGSHNNSTGLAWP